jgi:hypothetical protein
MKTSREPELARALRPVPAFERAVREVSKMLFAAGIRHALVGALGANAYRSRPRTTEDIDFLVGNEAFETHAGGWVTMRVPVILALEASGPVRQEMRLVDQEDGPSLLESGLLYASPEAFPKARHHCLGTIRSGVDRGVSIAFEKLEEQGGLADLTRTGEELDTTRRGLGQAASEKLSALGEAQPVFVRRHSRIIIRLWLKIKAERDPRLQLLRT